MGLKDSWRSVEVSRAVSQFQKGVTPREVATYRSRLSPLVSVGQPARRLQRRWLGQGFSRAQRQVLRRGPLQRQGRLSCPHSGALAGSTRAEKRGGGTPALLRPRQTRAAFSAGPSAPRCSAIRSVWLESLESIRRQYSKSRFALPRALRGPSGAPWLEATPGAGPSGSGPVGHV